MSDEVRESSETTTDEQPTDDAARPARRQDGAACTGPRVGTALSVLWWDERAPASGE